MSEDSTSWADPWDSPINPVYDTVTGELIGAADVPRSVPYWATDGERSEDSIQTRDNDSWSFMTYSNTHSGRQSDLDAESLDPLGLPKSHHWESERAKHKAILPPNPPSHNICCYIPPELRDENVAANRKNRLSRNQLNRFYEIIEGHCKRSSNPQIGRDAAIQHENWRKAEAGFESRTDNRKPLSTRAGHLINPMDRRAPATSWQQSSTSNMIPVSRDSRYYAEMSSPINSKHYFASDVPTRFVTPSQEHFSDSRFVKPAHDHFRDSCFVKPAHDHFSDYRFFTPSQKYLSDSRFVKPSQEHFRDSRFFTPSQKHIRDSRFVKPCEKHISDSRFVKPSQERFSGSLFVTPSKERFSGSRFVTPSQEHSSGSRFVTPSQKHISNSRFVTSSQKHIRDSRFVTPAQEHSSNSRFVTPSQERFSDSRFLPANFANHQHAQCGHPRKYCSSGRLDGRRSVKPPDSDAKMCHYPSSPRTYQNNTRNPDIYVRGATNHAYYGIERKPLPTSNFHRYCPHTSANISSFGNRNDNYHGFNTMNYPLPSDQYYRNNYEHTSTHTLRRSANYENLRGLPIRTVQTNSRT